MQKLIEFVGFGLVVLFVGGVEGLPVGDDVLVVEVGVLGFEVGVSELLFEVSGGPTFGRPGIRIKGKLRHNLYYDSWTRQTVSQTELLFGALLVVVPRVQARRLLSVLHNPVTFAMVRGLRTIH